MQALVICDQERTGGHIQQVLLRHGHQCPAGSLLSLERALDRLDKLQPDLMVVALSGDAERGAALRLSELRMLSQAPVVSVGPATDPRLVLQTLRAGASDYVDEADLENELVAALLRLESKLAPRSAPGRVIALVAASGGSGASTLAVNVATVLAKEHGRALLVDLKLEMGDLATLMDLRPTHSLAGICQNLTQVDRVMFERSLADHGSGVRLLAAPSFAEARDVTAQGVQQALILGRGLFPYVVLDVDHSLRAEQVQALQLADIVLMVLRLDFAALRNTKRFLDHLGQVGIPADRIHAVVNRYGQPNEVPVAKAEEALGIKITHFVPEEAKTVNRANNHGVPVVLDAPSARFAKSVTQLAFSVNGSKGASSK